jgi:hypothetical protein
MLAFKTFSQNLFDQRSERGLPLYTTLSPNMALFGSSDLTGSGFNLITGGRGLIRGNSQSNAGASNDSSPSLAVSLASAGTHLGSNANGPNVFAGTSPYFYSTNYNIQYAGGSASVAAYTPNNDGAHSHTVDGFSGFSSYVPTNIAAGMFSISASSLVPQNGIILAANVPDGFTSFTSWNGKFLSQAQSTAAIGTSSGSDSSSHGNSTTSAGDHDHESGGVGTYYTFTYNSTGANYTYLTISSATGGGHSHTLTWGTSYTVGKYIRLSAHSSNGGAFLTKGCIVMWNNSSAALPAGWFFCDGGTYNGFTTPNINGTNIVQLSGTHGSVNNSTNNINLTGPSADNPSHTHFYTANYSKQSSYYTGSHLSYTWNHSHSYSATGGFSPAFDPPTYEMPFIIYLP